MKKIILILILFPSLVLGQEIMQADSTATKTIDGTIGAMLKVINGEKGKTRNWQAFKSLFLSTVRFTAVNPEGNGSYETADLNEMIEFMHDDYYDSGYEEKTLNRTIERFSGVAHVFEVVMHTEPDGSKTKGLNSYQLVFSEGRWWIANIVWTFETDDVKIPEKYIKN